MKKTKAKLITIKELLEDRRFCSVRAGVFKAEKAFVYNSILNEINKRYSTNLMSDRELEMWYAVLESFLDGNVRVYWKDDKIFYKKGNRVYCPPYQEERKSS
tara:strand:+ start:2239 stop:2544 length:306 start_codon:yes stop_codon:yes gene_type:complete